MMKRICSLAIIFSVNSWAFGLSDCTLTANEQASSVSEHVYGGAPDNTELYERRAYVLSYDHANLVPKWVAWHVTKEYRDTPKRDSRWKSFRTDPELPTVKDDDYKDWYASEKNYARGHIAPFFISGGDRDGDGMDAEIEATLKVEDEDDACTVYEINAMSNIAPQYHSRFNGQPGVWWQLETEVRSMIDTKGTDFHVFAGSVFLPNKPIERVGDRDDAPSTWKIGVPHGFFKIVIDSKKQQAVGFLMDHAGDLAKGCDLSSTNGEPSKCIVTISDIENVTGLKFFSDLSSTQNQVLRSASNTSTWTSWTNTL